MLIAMAILEIYDWCWELWPVLRAMASADSDCQCLELWLVMRLKAMLIAMASVKS